MGQLLKRLKRPSWKKKKMKMKKTSSLGKMLSSLRVTMLDYLGFFRLRVTKLKRIMKVIMVLMFIWKMVLSKDTGFIQRLFNIKNLLLETVLELLMDLMLVEQVPYKLMGKDYGLTMEVTVYMSMLMVKLKVSGFIQNP